MRLESKETIDPDGGIARHWVIGPLLIEWYVERPREEWLRFDGQLSVRWIDD
jgi:hypothetical protein